MTEATKVLTPAEVADIRSVMESPATAITKAFLYRSANSVLDSHEALRAELSRLRGLIEGMGHEAGCKSLHRFVHEEPCGFEGEGPRKFDTCPSTCHPAQCNCILSKINP